MEIISSRKTYYVDIMEYEAGWGSRLDERRAFLSKKKAKRFADDFNSKNTSKTVPSWYMTASEPYESKIKMSYRKLYIGRDEWRYLIGKSSVVIIRQNGQKKVVSLAKVLKVSQEDLERARYKHTDNCNCGPKDIETYIRENLLDDSNKI